HARHDRIGAVLLDVSVDTLVDVAALLVVAIFAGPCAEQIVVERRPAGGAAIGRRPVEALHHLWDRSHFLRDDLAADIAVAEAGALAHRLHLTLAGIGIAQRQA